MNCSDAQPPYEWPRLFLPRGANPRSLDLRRSAKVETTFDLIYVPLHGLGGNNRKGVRFKQLYAKMYLKENQHDEENTCKESRKEGSGEKGRYEEDRYEEDRDEEGGREERARQEEGCIEEESRLTGLRERFGSHAWFRRGRDKVSPRSAVSIPASSKSTCCWRGSVTPFLFATHPFGG